MFHQQLEQKAIIIIFFDMKNFHAIIAVFLLLLLISIKAQSPNQLTYSFPFNGTAGAINSYYAPAYQLGTLSANYSITILITLPNAADSTQLAGLVSEISLEYIDYSSGSLVMRSAVNAGGTNFVFPPSTHKTTYSATYAVNFPASTSITSASFVLLVSYSSLSASSKLDYYNLEVTYFPTTQGISVSNLNTVATILKVTDVMRNNIIKLVFVNSLNGIYNFTAFPASFRTGQVVNDMFAVNVYPVMVPSFFTNGLSSNDYTIGAGSSLMSNERKDVIGTAQQPIYSSNIGHYTYTFAAQGFYLLEFIINQPSSFDGRITFDTDPYACPYSSSYGDFYSNFQGCSTSTASNGLPCINFSPVTGQCSLCMEGYQLVNGQCLVNTTCPDRQFFQYGACLNVSATCGAYDHFTGDCLNCSDPSRYYIDNGSCVEIIVTCGPRQWLSNYVCYDVSQTCATFDTNTGNCLSCLGNLYQLNSDGTCTLIVINCHQGQYLVNSTCKNIPAECLEFNTTLEQCSTCIRGYYIRNGVCLQLVCPQGQVLAKYGVFCVDISPLCDDYDMTTGDCLTCKGKGYTVRNGDCVQVTSPLAGCKQRQALGFGPCVGADINCQTFNLISGDCDECITGHYLDYTGHCVVNADCGPGQWSTNGQCLKMPQNCLKVDSLGLCTQCANSSYRVVQGQCVYFQVCTQRQYLNSGGLCTNVDPSCSTWNPSNGYCITCVTPGTSPTSGVCCPRGQVYDSGQCVNAQQFRSSNNGPSCLIRHPSLNFCLRCSQGFTPDYSIPYACAAN